MRGEVAKRGGVDAEASSTTNDKEIARNPHPPKGLRRDAAYLFVPPPRRWLASPSSSRLDLGRVAPATTIGQFLTQDTSQDPIMSWDETEDSTEYKVVINEEAQYSIWPTYRDNPPGWKDGGKTGTKKECLDYIGEVWTDMRPRSLREKMDGKT